MADWIDCGCRYVWYGVCGKVCMVSLGTVGVVDVVDVVDMVDMVD